MTDDYKLNVLDALRNELVEIVSQELSPKARRYGYSDVSLESMISWKPVVLVLGNYSSGKSTLINELVGSDVQATGQAPTDDSFTVITGKRFQNSDTEIETRDGKAILNDPEFPFESLKRHGDRFSAHFKLKRINSSLLDNLAIIDTPGMLDSVSEYDRGYDYQEVISDFAAIADLTLVLFDPHKAGTVRESHQSLRETLPASTFEDRVVFVLNRVDECGSLDDLLRVYGTLCWNLSQMTGRKDIPRILLSYASNFVGDDRRVSHLSLLDNQRRKLVGIIKDAPKARLDNMASFMEQHALKLKWILKGLYAYKRKMRSFQSFVYFLGALGCLFAGFFMGIYSYYVEPWGVLTDFEHTTLGVGFSVGLYFTWIFIVFKFMLPAKSKLLTVNLAKLVVLENKHELDVWQSVLDIIRSNITERNLGSLSSIKRDLRAVELVLDQKSTELRKAIGEVVSGEHDQPPSFGDES